MIARRAEYDGTCPLCDQAILGLEGKRPRRPGRSLEPEPAHPPDTVDWIVRLDDVWVHAECARESGEDVHGDE